MITEEDGSGVDRGDFIDEIGSDTPFAGEVGILGITEAFEKPDAISVKTRISSIKGGGIYSVNSVSEEKILLSSMPSNIELNAKSIELDQGTLAGLTKSDDVKYVEKTIIQRTSSRVKLNNQPYNNIGTLNIYIDDALMIEGLDYELRYNSKGKLFPVSFNEKIPKGSVVEFVVRPQSNYTSPKGSVSATDNIIIKDSNLEFGDLEIDGLNVDIVASEISGLNYINIKSIGSINIADESSIMSSFSESGNVKLSGVKLRLKRQRMSKLVVKVMLKSDGKTHPILKIV